MKHKGDKSGYTVKRRCTNRGKTTSKEIMQREKRGNDEQERE